MSPMVSMLLVDCCVSPSRIDVGMRKWRTTAACCLVHRAILYQWQKVWMSSSGVSQLLIWPFLLWCKSTNVCPEWISFRCGIRQYPVLHMAFRITVLCQNSFQYRSTKLKLTMQPAVAKLSGRPSAWWSVYLPFYPVPNKILCVSCRCNDWQEDI